MSKFKVGDRVRYYGAFNEDLEVVTAEVVKLLNNGLLRIETDNLIIYAHPKQCRKLKPKKKPLRVEGVVSWESLKGYATPSAHDCESLVNQDFDQFVGKRTKIIVEEIK